MLRNLIKELEDSNIFYLNQEQWMHTEDFGQVLTYLCICNVRYRGYQLFFEGLNG